MIICYICYIADEKRNAYVASVLKGERFCRHSLLLMLYGKGCPGLFSCLQL